MKKGNVMLASVRTRIFAVWCVVAFAPGNTSAQTSAVALPASASSGETISYVCGDATLDQHPPPTSDGHAFNLGVSFASAKTGEALSNVAVRLRRHGRVLLDFTAIGPRCLFSVPEADYRLEGIYSGEMRFEIVEPGSMNTQMRW
jgi:hypothetical protein